MSRHVMNPRERLVFYVQELERVERLKREANDCVKDAYEAAKAAGYDTATLKVVLKLRKMTPDQRKEKRALEGIYMAMLGMLEGDPLTDEARRRLDPQPPPAPESAPKPEQPELLPDGEVPSEAPPAPAPPAQPPLVLKTPDEARQEGETAAAAGKRVYDNPYPAGDPCRAAWDEGWCKQQKSHGMETPLAYQRRSPKPEKPEKDEKPDRKSGGAGDSKEAP